MTLARSVAMRLYGLLFRLLIVVVPHAEELDIIVDILNGDSDGRLL
jgi:hypothetical protein